RRMSVPADFVFFSRLNLSMNAIFTALRAVMYGRAMVDDMDGVAAPVTELGRQHVAWVRKRSLPFGMDYREDH
ncbi:MAG: AarF/ABC1/UbiB kinase family protein, partial [Mycobacterium sp.]|nr:AarF/ABC1/UbiB kinase family protein [Mycobacterium sp.]